MDSQLEHSLMALLEKESSWDPQRVLKWEEVANLEEDRAGIRDVLDGLEHWAKTNRMNSNRVKCT